MNQGKIMTIQCATCGAPAQFDVVTQNYHCPSCGGNTGTEIPLKSFRNFGVLRKPCCNRSFRIAERLPVSVRIVEPG